MGDKLIKLSEGSYVMASSIVSVTQWSGYGRITVTTNDGAKHDAACFSSITRLTDEINQALAQ